MGACRRQGSHQSHQRFQNEVVELWSNGVAIVRDFKDLHSITQVLQHSIPVLDLVPKTVLPKRLGTHVINCIVMLSEAKHLWMSSDRSVVK